MKSQKRGGKRERERVNRIKAVFKNVVADRVPKFTNGFKKLRKYQSE